MEIVFPAFVLSLGTVVLMSIPANANGFRGGAGQELQSHDFEGPGKFCTTVEGDPFAGVDVRVNAAFSPTVNFRCRNGDLPSCATAENLEKCQDACEAFGEEGCCTFNAKRVSEGKELFGCAFFPGAFPIDSQRNALYAAPIAIEATSSSPSQPPSLTPNETPSYTPSGSPSSAPTTSVPASAPSTKAPTTNAPTGTGLLTSAPTVSPLKKDSACAIRGTGSGELLLSFTPEPCGKGCGGDEGCTEEACATFENLQRCKAACEAEGRIGCCGFNAVSARGGEPICQFFANGVLVKQSSGALYGGLV